MTKDGYNKLDRDFTNITELKKDCLIENFAQKRSLFEGNENIDYRKVKVLEKSNENDKKIEKINNKFFKKIPM